MEQYIDFKGRLKEPFPAQENFSFLLNMQMIADALEDEGIDLQFFPGNDKGRLSQVNFYHGQAELESNCVYLAAANKLPGILPSAGAKLCSLIVIGNPPASYRYGSFSLIIIRNSLDLFALYDIVQRVFQHNQQWNEEMQTILNNNGDISDLCRSAFHYFKNPLFVHNSQFYIIACPSHQENMASWDLDERTGLYMLSSELINNFKVSPVYFDTLTTEGAQIFPFDQVGYRVLYINIWNDFGRYEGRICIDELNTPLRKGQHLALEHLAKLFRVLLRRRNTEDTSFSRPFETFLSNVVSRKLTDRKKICGILSTTGWEIDDCYVCFKMALEDRDRELMSVVNTCNYIEATLKDCHAFSYEDNILVLLNLTKNGRELSECINDLTYIVREGLLKTGISNQFSDFMHFPWCYQQASLALYYGNLRQPTIWIHRYQDYVMDYIFDMVCKELPAEFICSGKLPVLMDYDRKNNTQLYQTLQIYMKHGQNAEQTSKELFLHRSTLFYRLRKIKALTGIDWSDEKERIYLQFSLGLMQHQKENTKNADDISG
ncbi:MAG: helix-turn-helix domain-containing protein [Lachnospiraceae bacterium]|nr:helix-turn-helix domain-containing protein [Lachnospiraceae bacterium]